MAIYAVLTTYTENAHGIAEFPDDKIWADVEDWYVKWDYLHVKFKGEEEWRELALDSTGESDWKRPASTEVMYLADDGYPDWDRETLATN